MNEELVLRFTALANPHLGIADSFYCLVLTASHEAIGSNNFNLTVVDEDVLKQLNREPISHVFEAEFLKFRVHVQYNLLPITGFVDRNRNAWKLITLDGVPVCFDPA